MAAADQNNVSLTGMWRGQYAYAGELWHQTDFSAEIVEHGGPLTGTTEENVAGGRLAGTVLRAVLNGTRCGPEVRFRKQYAAEGPNDAVDYDGTVSDDGLEIGGTWHIANEIHGSFVMVRSRFDEPLEIERSADMLAL